MSLTIPHRRLPSGRLLLGVVVALAVAVLAGVAALPPSAPITDTAARVDVRAAADWIELGLVSALTCHGGLLPPGEAGDQEHRASAPGKGMPRAISRMYAPGDRRTPPTAKE